jgi:hypothetical protein
MQRARILLLSTLAALAAPLMACSSGHLGDGPTGPSESPGTVTLRLLLTPGQSFCDEIDGCSSPIHVFIGKEPGNWLTAGKASACAVDCSTCAAHPCPAYAPTICAAVAVGVAVTNVEATWDGSYIEGSTCGAGTACTANRFVPPGRYAARLCATPGTLTGGTGGTCMPTGPQECVDTTFDLPGPPLVEVPLPGSAID